MAGETRTAVLRDFQTLFDYGVVRDSSDQELLERFMTAEHGESEAAFTVLVERHGPLVLHVCRQVLNDPNDAQDAFQATFLVFLRRAGSIRNRDSLASWLFGVAMRVSRRARYTAIVRRFHERSAGEIAATRAAAPRGHSSVTLAALHDAIARLPQRFREPIVLCHLQGLSTAAAAQRLGCAQGTILSRLARARQRLRRKLTEQGRVELAELFVHGRLPQDAMAALPAAVVNSTVQTAVHALAGRSALTGFVTPSVVALAHSTLRTLIMTRITLATALVTTVAVVVAITIPVIRPSRAAGSQTASTTAQATQEKRRTPPTIEQKTIASADVVDALCKILKRDREFNDSRWPFTIKVRDVQEKALIDATFTHRIKGKDNAYDVIIRAKRAVLSFNSDRKVIRAVLEEAEVQQLVVNDTVFMIFERILEIPVPPGDPFKTAQRQPPPTAASEEHRIVTPGDRALTLVYSPDGKTLATAGFAGVVHLWDMVNHKRLGVLKGATSTIRSVTFSPDGKTVACVNDAGLVRLWDVPTGDLKKTLPGLSDSMRQAARDFMLDSIAFAPDGQILAVSGFGPTRAERADRIYELRVFDVKTGQPIWSHMGRGEQACSLAFAPDGATLARAGWTTVKLWDAKTGEPVRTLTPTKGTIFAVAFTPGGQALVGGGNIATNDADHQAGLVTLWNLMTGQIIHTLEGHTGGVHAVAVSPDGRMVASGGDSYGRSSLYGSPSEIKLWDITTGKLLRTIDGERGVVRSLAFAPNGKTLVYCDDGTVGIINIETGKIDRVLTRF